MLDENLGSARAPTRLERAGGDTAKAHAPSVPDAPRRSFGVRTGRHGHWSLIVALLSACLPAHADELSRVRGVVVRMDDRGITVQERDGVIRELRTGPGTTYADVVPSSLDAVEVDDFVGTAVKGPPGAMVAVELAIIPDAMRAGRVAHYGWDPLPDPTAGRDAGPTATTMVNGLVSGARPGSPGTARTASGEVIASERQVPTGRVLDISYGGGAGTFRITVPGNAPVVRYVLTDRSALAVGSDVFIKGDRDGEADLVTIGRGVTPPM